MALYFTGFDMWPISGTFCKCCRELCSQVVSCINDSLYFFRREQIEERTMKTCDSLHYIEGKNPENKIFLGYETEVIKRNLI